MKARQQRDVSIGPHRDREDIVNALARENLPPLISPVRVAKLLDLERQRIYELVATGDLAAVRVGRRGLRIFRESLLDWLRRGGSGPGH